VSRPGTMQPHPYETGPYPEHAEQKQDHSRQAWWKAVDSWMSEESQLIGHGIKRQKAALFLLRLPAFVPLIFILRGWIELNAKDVLTNTEADVLGTGGEICFFLALSITPLITLTGQRWFTPLRRWYGVMFAIIGIADATTAALTANFAGGVFGRLAGHTFLVVGLFIVLLSLPLLATGNTPAQRKLGRYWKRLHKMTYVIWGLIGLHLLLLDGFKPFGGPEGDGDPVFHQRFYQATAISLPLIILRLPPVRRWIAKQRAAGQQWRVWLAVMPLAALYIVGFAFIINEEIFTGTKVITMHPPSN
jgi:methionine sulfoxide reductase heme-binding subunit